MIGYRIAFERSAWSCGEAWLVAVAQQIPGCPDMACVPWRRDHTATEWAWIYRPHYLRQFKKAG